MLTELVFIAAVLDTHKGCDVACFDILKASLYAYLDKDVTMILKGRLAKLFV